MYVYMYLYMYVYFIYVYFIHISQYIMEVEVNQKKFMSYVKQYKPQTQILRYLFLFDLGMKALATRLKDYFLNLALDNNLIGCYTSILAAFGEKAYPKYESRKQVIQTEMIKITNQLKKELQILRSKNNTLEMSKLSLKIANQFFRYGIYSEAEDYLKKIKEMNQIPTDQYYPLNVKINTLNKKFEWSRGLNIPPDVNRKLTQELKQYYICQDLRELYEGKEVCFVNTVALNLTQAQITNDIMTDREMGELYSIFTLLSGVRQNSNKFVRWSSKLQKLHITFRYKELLERVNEILQRFEYDPFISKRIPNIKNRIRSNIFFEVLKVYKIIKIEELELELGLREEEIKKILRERVNSDELYLIDPLSKTINLSQNKSKLLKNVELIHRYLSAKQLKILKHRFNEDDEKFGRLEGFSGSMGIRIDDDDDDDDYRR